MRANLALLAGALLGFALACSDFKADLQQYCSERRCTAPTDCCDGWSCSAGRCQAPAGQTDGGGVVMACTATCAGQTPVCDTATGSCVRCTAASCGSGKLCDLNSGCVGCTLDAGCAVPTPVCRPLQERCVECDVDAQCAGKPGTTCNRQTGVCEIGGADAGYDAGVPFALKVIPATGPEFVGRCSGQWRVETVDVLDASVPFYGPVDLESDYGNTRFFDQAGCTSAQLPSNQLRLDAPTGRGSFWFITDAEGNFFGIRARYESIPLQYGEGRVDVKREVETLDISPNPLDLTINQCGATAVNIQLLRQGSAASFTYDTALTVSGTNLELYGQAGCAQRLLSPIYVPKGTSQLRYYVKANGPASGLSFSLPGVSGGISVNVTIPPDAISLDPMGGPKFGLPKDACNQMVIHVMGSNQVVTTPQSLDVQLTSDAGTTFYTSAGCSGAFGTSVDVNIPASNYYAYYWIKQPASGADQTGIAGTVLGGGLAGDSLDLTFSPSVGDDGGP